MLVQTICKTGILMKVGPKRKSSMLATLDPVLIDQLSTKHRIPDLLWDQMLQDEVLQNVSSVLDLVPEGPSGD